MILLEGQPIGLGSWFHEAATGIVYLCTVPFLVQTMVMADGASQLTLRDRRFPIRHVYMTYTLTTVVRVYYSFRCKPRRRWDCLSG